ncbi:hypothetical protein BZA77DRAFT_352418 [Pyronema omphalodes]|nr:hypothetical protein BZA77DRAFT_352418 [Pyronema omphalodes]
MPKDILKHAGGNFTHLNDHNYATWAANMKRALRTERAWNIVLGHETHVTIALARAVSLLFNAMTEEICSQLDDFENPTELWKNRKEEYSAADSKTGRRRLTNRFLALRPVPGKPIAEFSATAINLRRELKDAKEAISDNTS